MQSGYCKHGRKVHLMQFAQKRLAEVAMDLWGLAAVISRTTAFIEAKGRLTRSGKSDLQPDIERSSRSASG